MFSPYYIFFFLPSLSLTYLFFWVTLVFSPAHPLSLSWPTCAFSVAIYYPLHIFLPLSPAIWAVCTHFFPPLYLSPSLSPSTPHPRLSANAFFFTSLCLFTCDPLFSLSQIPSDWQISTFLVDLHKSLPSHFLTEMASVPICSVSDHIEHPMHAALIPIFFFFFFHTYSKKEEGAFWVWVSLFTFKGWCFYVPPLLQKCVSFPLVVQVKGQNYSLLSTSAGKCDV